MSNGVLDHHFIHAAEIVLPWPSSPDAEPNLAEGHCYWRVHGSLADLLEPQFIEAHMRAGELRAFSTSSSGNKCTVAIVPPGNLLLVCKRDVYEHLGLDGNPSMLDQSR
jgi:hypothetical protein